MAWTAPRTWVSGETVTSTIMNTHVRDNLLALTTWTTYTPTWIGMGSSPALGNGTLTGHYIEAGDLIYFQVSLTTGSTTTYGSGEYRFSLPVTAAEAQAIGGGGYLFDTSAADHRDCGLIISTGALGQVRMPYAAGSLVSATLPWTWANGDMIQLAGFYRAP